jgi:hypothetical protein
VRGHKARKRFLAANLPSRTLLTTRFSHRAVFEGGKHLLLWAIYERWKRRIKVGDGELTMK